MKFYGNIHLNQNLLQKAALETEYDWPTDPVVGQIAFINRVVYICIQITGGIPVWVPLTRELEMYVHVQDTASAEWNITHTLNTPFVIVQVFDNLNKVIIPDNIAIVDASNIDITFNVSATGRAVILSGSIEGGQKPTYSFEYMQTDPQSNWVVNHNLGHYPVIRVFSGSYEIQPGSINHTSMNSVTISFTTPQTGVAKLV